MKKKKQGLLQQIVLQDIFMRLQLKTLHKYGKNYEK